MLGRRALTSVLPASLAAILTLASGSYAQDAPKILLDQPPRAVEYQLGRLSNEELVLVERKEGDVRYRPVYFALLTRRGVAPQFRDEALTALVGLDKTSKSRVLLEALSKVPIRRCADRRETARPSPGAADRHAPQRARHVRPGDRYRVEPAARPSWGVRRHHDWGW